MALNMQRQTSEILDRMPPQSLDSEKGVLGSLLLDPKLCDQVATILKPDDFYADAHRKLFKHVLALFDGHRAVDVALIMERLKQAGEVEAVGGAAYLAEILQAVPVAAHAIHYAGIVREKSKRRRLIQAATAMLRDAFDESAPIEDVISDCEAHLQKIPSGEYGGEPVEFSTAVADACVAIDEIYLRKRVAGTMIGLETFDQAAGGVFTGELVLLAARTSVGKTSLGLQIAQNVAARGRSVYLASLEMKSTELALRVLCGQAGVSLSRVRAADIGPADIVDMTMASQSLASLPILLHDRPGLSTQDIRRATRRLASKLDLGLIVVDYMQRITPVDRSVPRHLQVGQIAWDLKSLALELRVPVLCLTQLSRAAEERDKKTGNIREPRLSDLKDSGNQEEDADMVLLLHRQPRARDAKLLLAKNRQGEQGAFHLVFDAARMRFECAMPVRPGNYEAAFDKPVEAADDF
jgi:replicative DNA helicase